MCDTNKEETAVEIEMTEEEFEALEAYQRDNGFETLNDLITHILKEGVLKAEKEQDHGQFKDSTKDENLANYVKNM